MFWKKDVLFCDISPTTYAISLQKEICKRHIQNFLTKEKFASTFQSDPIENLVAEQHSNMIKRAAGVNLESQKNKAENINLACQKMNGIMLYPGETFSFWKLVGKISEKKGYKAGRVIEKNKLTLGIGGGICNLANTIHLLVVHSPLTVTEFHNHSDALAPDEGERIPLSAGTSISYNHVDYRFKNTTDQIIQLLLWCEGETLHAELRSQKAFPWQYRIFEEEHHFKKEGEKFYRISKIYREVIDVSLKKILAKELILDNHSEVMFDYNLIPKNQIRNE